MSNEYSSVTLAGPTGIEPISQASETCILSIEIRARKKAPFGAVFRLAVPTVAMPQRMHPTRFQCER